MIFESRKKLFWILGLLGGGVVAVSCLIALVVTTLQLFVLMPSQTYNTVYEDAWKSTNVRLMGFAESLDFKKAETRLKKQIHQSNASDPVPYYLLGSLYQFLDRRQEAQSYYRAMLNITEKSWYNQLVYRYFTEDAYADMALNYYENNNPATALTLLQKVQAPDELHNGKLFSALKNVLEEPERADFHFALGQEFRHLLKLDSATREVRKALALSTDPRLKVQATNFLKNEMPLKTRSLSPLVRYYNLAGDAYGYEATNLRQAADFYEQAIAEAPDFEWPYHHLSIVYRELKDYPKAMNFARKAAEMNPRFYLPHLTMGDVELDRANYRAALAHFSQARRILRANRLNLVESHDVEANIENQMGFAWESLNDLKSARAHYQATLEIAAEDSEDYQYAQSAIQRLKASKKQLY